MTNLVPHQPQQDDAQEGERIEKHQPLYPGHYWKAKKDIKDREIPSGCVLLLKRIKRVDDKPHAVQLAGHPLLHPDSSFEFLVHDFLNDFEPEPNGAAIRAQEMKEIQLRIEQQQRELLNFQSSPVALLEHLKKHPALPAPKSVRRNDEDEDEPKSKFDFEAGLPDANFRPNTEIVALTSNDADRFRRQAENQAILAKTRANLIEQRSEAIAESVGQLTPFYREQAVVALAQSSDALEMYKKLKSGLATLGLYTGEDVQVTKVRGGKGAAAEEPIYILQALLYMDEESLINLQDGGADFKDFKDFVKLLKEDDALLKRLVPYNRAVVAMRYRHNMKDYQADAFVQMRMDEENSKCFLIIRNGERVHCVHSSLEKMDRLFPTQSDLDEPFTRSGWFRGVESERITIEDVKFAEARSKFDSLVLHYRRVLILLAGLYDREREVLGEIAALVDKPTGMTMLSLPMQEEIFRPVSDEEYALGTGRPDFYSWLEEKNKLAQSGSRLLCIWKKVMTPESAPGAVVRRHGTSNYDEFRYEPTEKFGVAIAYARGDSVRVRVSVKGESWQRRGRDIVKRDFDCQVDIGEYEKHGSSRGEFGYLCLDNVTPEEINYYIYTRYGRRDYVNYVPILVAARELLQKDAAREAPLRERLYQAVKDGGVQLEGVEAQRAIGEVIRQWRAAHRGEPVPLPKSKDYVDEERSMLNQLWVLAGHGRDRKKLAEEIATAEGRRPLRLTLSGKNRLYLYATARTDEEESLLGPHPWVARLALSDLKTKMSVSARTHIILPKLDASESVLAEWADSEKLVEPKLFHTLAYDEVRALRNMGRETQEKAERWLSRRTDSQFDADLELIREDTRKRSPRYITHGAIFFPLCIARRVTKHESYAGGMWDSRRKKETTYSYKYFVGGIIEQTVRALYLNATEAQRQKIVRWFKDYYEKADHALKSLNVQATFRICALNDYPHVQRDTFVGTFGEYGDGKSKSWSGDQKEFMDDVKKSYHANDSTAEMIIKFDDAAQVVYRLIKE